MTYQHLTYETHNHIALITLDNPEKMNAMTAQMVTSFSRAVEAARCDDQVRVVVLTGRGRGFCSGADTELLIALAQGKPAQNSGSEDSRRHYMEPIGWFGAEIAQLEKPSIAAINGSAAGGGFAAEPTVRGVWEWLIRTLEFNTVRPSPAPKAWFHPRTRSPRWRG